MDSKNSIKNQTEIREAVSTFGSEETFSYHDIGVLVSIHETTTGAILREMADAGEITRLGRGMYRNVRVVPSTDTLTLDILKVVGDKTFASDRFGNLYVVRVVAV